MVFAFAFGAPTLSYATPSMTLVLRPACVGELAVDDRSNAGALTARFAVLNLLDHSFLPLYSGWDLFPPTA